MNFKLRAATKEDCKEISRMISELAVHDKMHDQVKISLQEIMTPLLKIIQRPCCEQFYVLKKVVLREGRNLYGRYLQSNGQLTPKHSATELERDGFCQNPLFECVVAEVPEEHKSKEGFIIVGYALYYYTYSTWKGRVIYLEDLYVMPEFRGRGIGTGLLSKVAEVGKKKQCVRLQLSVLDWDTRACEFYAAKGAQDLTVSEGWHFIRFDGQNLDNLANEAPKD